MADSGSPSSPDESCVHTRSLRRGPIRTLTSRKTNSGWLTWRATLTGLAVAILAISGFGMIARYLPIANHVTVAAAALSPYLMSGAITSAVLGLVLRRWIVTIIATCLTVATVILQLPLYTAGHNQPEASRPLRIMTANLSLGMADASALSADAQRSADVLAVQELTFTAANSLSNAGIDETFPHKLLYPHDRASGAGIWSRFPLHSTGTVEGFEMTFLRARIQFSGLSADPTIAVAHLSGPWPQAIVDWREDLEQLPKTMNNLANEAGNACVIVAGDFNSTMDMRPFRELLRDGYGDAVEQSGAGFTPTYPGIWGFRR